MRCVHGRPMHKHGRPMHSGAGALWAPRTVLRLRQEGEGHQAVPSAQEEKLPAADHLLFRKRYCQPMTICPAYHARQPLG